MPELDVLIALREQLNEEWHSHLRDAKDSIRLSNEVAGKQTDLNRVIDGDQAFYTDTLEQMNTDISH